MILDTFSTSPFINCRLLVLVKNRGTRCVRTESFQKFPLWISLMERKLSNVEYGIVECPVPKIRNI